MALDVILIGFTFGAGAIAFLNPCGFAMLPLYISYFFEKNSRLQQETMISDSNSIKSKSNTGLLNLVRRLTYGVLVGLLVTVGFIVFFGLIGLGVSAVGTEIAKYFPWIAVLSGIIMIGIGITMMVGKAFHVNIPIPMKIIMHKENIHGNDNDSPNNNSNKNSIRNKSSYLKFFLFGIGYAIASLSCTLPIFLLVVFQGLSAGGIIEGSIVFLSYALGMGLVMIAISLAIGISNQPFVKSLRGFAPKMSIITSLVLILAGGYLIYYNVVVGKLLGT